MKKLAFFASLLVLVSSCDVIVVNPQTYDARDRFIGTYQFEDYSTTYDEYWNYGVTIMKSGYSNEIILNNFYNSGLNVYARVSGNRLTIPWQRIDGYELQGNGTVDGNSRPPILNAHISLRLEAVQTRTASFFKPPTT